MKGWLLDTNVLSELRKPRCARQVRRWVRAQPARDLYVSSISFAEIRFGINRLAEAERRKTLHRWLNDELRSWFDERVLEVDEDVILRWREMVEIGRQVGRTFSQPDLFLAATADVHGMCLVTRNTKDFNGIDMELLDPWK